MGQMCLAEPSMDGGGYCAYSSGTVSTTTSSTTSGSTSSSGATSTSSSGSSSSATTSTSSSGGTTSGNTPVVFEGRVQLNGGAVPTRDAWVYGFQGIPFLNGTSIGGYAFIATADAGGTFAISSTVTDGGYAFAAQYDLDGDGLSSLLAGDALNTNPVFTAAPNLGLLLDIETSTCFSVTAQVQLDGGVHTYLAAVGAQVFDTVNGKLFMSGGDLTTAQVSFDAGSGVTFNGGPGTQQLTFETSTGANPYTWVYSVPTGGTQPLPDTGAFVFTLSDLLVTSRTPSTPAAAASSGMPLPPPSLATR